MPPRHSITPQKPPLTPKESATLTSTPASALQTKSPESMAPPTSGAPEPGWNGSILSQAVAVSSLQSEYIKMCIYGKNRVGKTTLACDFPKPLLLIAFEPNRTGGALSVTQVPGVSYIKITSLKDALKLAEELAGDRHFKTHVLDTATSYQELILQEILNLPAIPEQLDWGMVSQDQYRERSEKTKNALRPFLNLPAHTVVCAKEKDHNPPKQERNKLLRGLQLESYFAADLGGATVDWLHDACDYIGRLYLDKEIEEVRTEVPYQGTVEIQVEYKETGRIVRRLRTMYHPNFAAGFRSCRPDTVPEFIENPTFAKISAVIRGEKLSPVSTTTKGR